MLRATLPAEARLQKNLDFLLAFKKGKKIDRGNYFIVIAANANLAKDNRIKARIGIVIPKKFVKKAVIRNTLKRIIRELFRKNRNFIKERDYIFKLYKKIPEYSTSNLKKIIHTELFNQFLRIKNDQKSFNIDY